MEQAEGIINIWCMYMYDLHIKSDNKLFDKSYIQEQRKSNPVALAREIREYVLQDEKLVKSSIWLSIVDNLFDEEHNAKGINYLNNLCPESNIIDTLQNISDAITTTNNLNPISIKLQLQSSSISSIISTIKEMYHSTNLRFMDFVINSI